MSMQKLNLNYNTVQYIFIVIDYKNNYTYLVFGCGNWNNLQIKKKYLIFAFNMYMYFILKPSVHRFHVQMSNGRRELY